jgi:hypothetical protein
VGGEQVELHGHYLDSPHTRLLLRLPRAQLADCAQVSLSSPSDLTCTLPANIDRFPGQEVLITMIDDSDAEQRQEPFAWRRQQHSFRVGTEHDLTRRAHRRLI